MTLILGFGLGIVLCLRTDVNYVVGLHIQVLGLVTHVIVNNTGSLLSGRDLIGVQNLMKKHQALLAELAGHEPRIGTVCGQGDQMVKEGHFAGDEITRKIQELQDKWNNLKVN